MIHNSLKNKYRVEYVQLELDLDLYRPETQVDRVELEDEKSDSAAVFDVTSCEWTQL